MFGRHLEMKLVKNSKTPITEEAPMLSIEEVERTANNLIKKISIAAVSIMAVGAALHTVSEIAINASNPKNKKS